MEVYLRAVIVYSFILIYSMEGKRGSKKTSTGHSLSLPSVGSAT